MRALVHGDPSRGPASPIARARETQTTAPLRRGFLFLDFSTGSSHHHPAPPHAVFSVVPLAPWRKTIAQTVIEDRDIYRAAKLLIDKHGGNGGIEASMRTDAMLEQGDLDGNKTRSA